MLEKSDIELLGQMMDEKIGSAISSSEERLGQMMDEKIGSAISASEERLSQMMDEKIGSAISASENRMMAYFEGKIEPQLQLLAEGHQQLLETLAPVSRVEALETDVSVLKYTVAQLAAEVKELKAAM